MAGGSGTRLCHEPRRAAQAADSFHRARSLLRLAFDRLDGLVPVGQRTSAPDANTPEWSPLAWPTPGRPFPERAGWGATLETDRVCRRGHRPARPPDRYIAVFAAIMSIGARPAVSEIVAHGFRVAAERAERAR